MSAEGEGAIPGSSDKSTVLPPEVLAGQDRLKQKFKVQEKVMVKLGFVDPSFDPDDFSRENYELPEKQEERARSWALVKNRDGKSRSDIFKEIYGVEIIKYPDQILSDILIEEIAEEIANKMRVRESEWS